MVTILGPILILLPLLALVVAGRDIGANGNVGVADDSCARRRCGDYGAATVQEEAHGYFNVDHASGGLKQQGGPHQSEDIHLAADQRNLPETASNPHAAVKRVASPFGISDGDDDDDDGDDGDDDDDDDDDAGDDDDDDDGDDSDDDTFGNTGGITSSGGITGDDGSNGGAVTLAVKEWPIALILSFWFSLFWLLDA